MYCKGVLQFPCEKRGVTTPGRLGSSLAVLDLEFYSPLYSSPLFLCWLAISPSPAVLLLYLLSPCSSSGSLLLRNLAILPLRFGTAHGLVPPLLGSSSQENSPGRRGIQDEPVLGQAVLMVLRESAQDRSPGTNGGAISQFWHLAPFLTPS